MGPVVVGREFALIPENAGDVVSNAASGLRMDGPWSAKPMRTIDHGRPAGDGSDGLAGICIFIESVRRAGC